MPSSRGLVRVVCVASLVLGSHVAASRAVYAQPAIEDDRSFEVQLFTSPVGARGFITIDSAQVPLHKQFSLSLVSNYQQGPFIINIDSSRPELPSRYNPVDGQMSSEITGAIGLLDKFEIGISVPITLYLNGDDFDQMAQPTGASLSGSGIGDIRIDGKAHLATFGPSNEFLFALSPGITLPTGNDSKFLGDRSATGRIRAITEFRPVENFRAAGMLGVLLRQTSKTFTAELGSQMLYGLASEYRIHKQFALVAEWFGRVGSFKYIDANPAEIDAGLRITLPKMLTLGFGGGAGLNGGIGAPKFRGWFAIGWAPDFRDRDTDGVYDPEDLCPDDPEDRDGFRDDDGCVDPDNDGDGLLDAADKCPNDAEDLDQFQDEDGCPEADNDGDGIADLNDACPNAKEDGQGKRPKDGCPSSAEDNDGDGVVDSQDKCADEPEDRDGFQDYDGCPDVDNDNDGIPDGFDSCPDEAEDADGFEDADGCPDPDNDKDGVGDGRDKCPAQPETLNGNNDDDGCPDSGAEIVRLGTDRIEVRERIGFTSKGRLSSGGAAVVKLVGMLMKAHRDLAKVRVEVHADSATKADTQTRADAVVSALVSQGIDTSRLKAVGAGKGGAKVDFIIEVRAEPKKAPTPAAP